MPSAQQGDVWAQTIEKLRDEGLTPTPADVAANIISINIIAGTVLSLFMAITSARASACAVCGRDRTINKNMDISVIVPLYNEEESLPELYAWIKKVMNEHNFSYEVIFVDDGSTDRLDVIRRLADDDPEHVRGVSFRRNYGKSPALNTGFGMARAEKSNHDGRRSAGQPRRNSELYRMITEENYDLVSGYKKNATIRCRRQYPQSSSTPQHDASAE